MGDLSPATAGGSARVRESVVAGRRGGVWAGVVGVCLVLGATGAGPAAGPAAAAADEYEADSWEDFDYLTGHNITPANVTLTGDIEWPQSGPGLVVPYQASWVIDLQGYTLSVQPLMGVAIRVEGRDVDNRETLVIRDSSLGARGSVIAIGASGSAGIGGGNGLDAGTIIIEGGTVYATGAGGGAGIGGGRAGSGGVVRITGGAVTATGSSWGANASAAIGPGAGDPVGALEVAGAPLPGSAQPTDAGSCLPTTTLTAPPGQVSWLEAATAPACTVTIDVGPGELPHVTSAGPDAATAGTPYDGAVTATGSPAPAFSVTAGTLPPGLALVAATGRLTGTPTTTGAFPVTLTATNTILGHTFTDSAPLTIAVAAAPLPPDPPCGGSAAPADPSGTCTPAGDPSDPAGGTDDPGDGTVGPASPVSSGGFRSFAATVPAADTTPPTDPQPAGGGATPVSSGTPTLVERTGLAATGADPEPLLATAVLLTAAGAALVGLRPRPAPARHSVPGRRPTHTTRYPASPGGRHRR